MNLLRKVFFGLSYLMPAILFFSYYPLISLGNDTTMNFELSLPLIWLVLFDLIGFILLIHLWRHRKTSSGLPGISDRRFFLFSLFPFYATISAFWSPNPTRALLTAGVLWCTFFAVFALLFIFPLLNPNHRWRQYFLKSIFISTAVVCVFCWLQCLLDLAGLSRSGTLLCAGCTFWTFGFPHPSGFAIEPQFMGNLLLAPTLLALFLLSFKQKLSLKPSVRRLLLVAAILFSATLFLTLSRGAIYAYAVALLTLFIFALVRRAKWQYLVVIPVATFFLTLTAQGIFSAVSPTPDTFHSGVAKVVHQLSLGLIDIRPSSASTPDPEDSLDPVNSDLSQAIFDGYIPASTNVRLGLSDLALRTWSLRPTNIVFGVGLGGAGLAISNAFPEHELALPNAIIQNEPLSLLLELGLVGIVLIIFSLLLAFAPHIFPRRFLDGRATSVKVTPPSFWSHPALPLLLSLILAYLVTLQFFSGLPNALQIYLMPPLFFLIFNRQNT